MTPKQWILAGCAAAVAGALVFTTVMFRAELADVRAKRDAAAEAQQAR